MRVQVFLIFAVIADWADCQKWTQPILDNFAQTLQIKWTVVDNTEKESRFYAEVSLLNKGSYTLDKNGEWKIFFNYVTMLEPDRISQNEVVLEGQGVKVTKYAGSLFSFEPTDDFLPLAPNRGRKIKLMVDHWQVSRTNSMPNWYLDVPELQQKVIQSTVGEELSFVESLTKPPQVKRYSHDQYSPFTAQERYRHNHLESTADDQDIRIIPKPLSMIVDKNSNVTVSNQTWKVYAADNLKNEAAYFSEMSGIAIAKRELTNDVIRMRLGDVVINNGGISGHPENYDLTVDPESRVIEITGQGESGVFRGIQSLLALLSQRAGMIYTTEIVDSPRYVYRGVHLDVSRNFKPMSDVLWLLGNMAIYKLNKLHLHLGDDEGWRLEIAGLEELTTVGAKRCHDPSELKCILPQFGSGPDDTTSGSGFYNESEYKEILREAKKLHIQVIPEFDMPGHSRAAIMSMEARYKRLERNGRRGEGLKYRLVEDGDNSTYMTPQLYTDDALNPCMESTYTFIDHVIREVARLHEGIQPLTLYHYGGDEVGEGAWVKSPGCKSLLNSESVSTDRVKELFFTRVANITARRNVSVAGWEDGLMQNGHAFDLSKVTTEAVAFSWRNIWEYKAAGHAYSFANNGYKVVLASATHLFLDHPSEPDPDERGHFWATRYTDDKKLFSYTPNNLYSLIDVKVSGEKITKKEACGDNGQSCPPLRKPENILGMESCLWSEEVRERGHMDHQLFPRLLSLAERAWHKASWEDETQSETGIAARKKDWESFARHVGRYELGRLDIRGVEYRIPPPGAIVQNGFLKYTTTYPGLSVQYSKDGGKTWYRANNNVLVFPHSRIQLRTRSTDLKRFSRTVTLHGTEPLPMVLQSELDYMAENIKIKYKVLDNFQDGYNTFLAQITFRNAGERDIVKGNWGIYFCSIYPIPEGQADLLTNHVTITHIKGCLFKLEPTADFKALKSKTERKLKFRVQNWSVSKTDNMPNWYVWAEGMQARTIASTRGPEVTFVEDYSTVRQWKRYNTTDLQDRYDPFTPGRRYVMSEDIKDMGKSQHPIIPTPVTMVMDTDMDFLDITSLKIISTDLSFAEEAHFLKDELAKGGYQDIKVTVTAPPSGGFIQLVKQDPQVIVNDKISTSTEAYSITVDPVTNTVRILSTTSAGIFNGVQSLLSLVLKSSSPGRIPKLTVEDAPRYEFRGMYLDVCRNFHSKEDILKLLDVMTMYKLNKFHIHLTEDEGWRLEIPGLEELTKVGGHRCHDLTEQKCVISQLGSGPDTTTSGSGFYTVTEYQEILRYAAARHIEVIPEVESPGHANAAIVSMNARRQRLLDIGDTNTSDRFTLSDKGDKSVYQSNQMFSDNAINPCIESTYTFFAHVVDKFIEIHKNINPLKSFHFGGDEVPAGTWKKSPACQSLLEANVSLKEYFTGRISEITAARGLNLAGWEDSMMASATQTFNRSMVKNKQAIANAWDNVWEWGSSTRAYVLANNDYKVVLSHATHLYFDHPYEPDPEERGFYWATRYTDTYKTYGYLPDSVYDNVDVKRSGEPMTKTELCGQDGSKCPPLEKPENIIGLQGHLWSETVRTTDHLFYMIFPRMIAVAEKAWHKPSWETSLNMTEKRNEWIKFTNTLGYQELPALDRMNVSYRVPLPGAKFTNGRLRVVSPVPGLKIETSFDGGKTWKTGGEENDVPRDTTVHVALKSADGKRRGRAIRVKIPGEKHSVVESGISVIHRDTMTLICIGLIMCRMLLR